MKYDFTTLPDRWDSGAEKFYSMRKKCPDVPCDIVPFSVADMDFLPPPELRQGLMDYVGNEILGYTLPSESYYDAVKDWLLTRHGLDIPGEWLMDADNVIGAMRQMIMAFSGQGDKIVVFSPIYPPFLSSVPALKRELVECPLILNDDFTYSIDYDLFESICQKPDTSMLLFCNPHNPIGKVWQKEDLIKVSEICLRNGVFVVSDEIHWDLIMPDARFTSMASLDEKYLANSAVNFASTKTFNTAALKGSTVIMPDPERREVYEGLNGIAGRGILSFIACEIGYRQCGPWLDELLLVLQDNRNFMQSFLAEHLPEVGVFPLEGTYLQWLDFRFLNMTPKKQEDFMAEKARCFFTEGYKFGTGGAGFERWNIACPKDVLEAGLLRMEKAVKSL